MSRPPRTSKPFKACTKCKALVRIEDEQCPICGSKEFTFEWSGIVIVIDPSKSKVAKALGITKPGRYALKLGV